jgi:hypothetical protein
MENTAFFYCWVMAVFTEALPRNSLGKSVKILYVTNERNVGHHYILLVCPVYIFPQMMHDAQGFIMLKTYLYSI